MKMEVKIFLVVEGEEGEIEIGIGEFLRSAAILDVLEVWRSGCCLERGIFCYLFLTFFF